MSYDIVFDRQFIKTTDGRIIPLVLIGCNNLTRTNASGREIVARDWSPLFTGCNRNIALSPDELMERAKSCTGGRYQEHFKRDGKWVDDAGLIRFFENGIRSAKTLVQLREECLNIHSIRAYFSIWEDGKDHKHTHEGSTYIHTDEDIIAFLESAEARLATRTDKETVYICMEFSNGEPLKRPKKVRSPKERLSEFFVVTASGLYVSKLTRRSLYRTHSPSYAKQFKTQREAEKWLDKNHIEQRFSLSFAVEKIAA